MRPRFTAWMFVFCLWIFTGWAQSASAQRQSQPPSSPVRADVNAPPITDADEARDRLTTEMAKKAAKERVAALKSETDRLLKLSVELKQSVDKSDENVLSLEVIKKAEEIEKLARSVKDKMKGPS
ncbi:MAG TPA: hypothetical protein VKF84_04330 [Candidatus Sulfotelmatobacter sp.]|nr:hypothetical protein [Candidatus Sulfotelmatobacter sp.]